MEFGISQALSRLGLFCFSFSYARYTAAMIGTCKSSSMYKWTTRGQKRIGKSLRTSNSIGQASNTTNLPALLGLIDIMHQIGKISLSQDTSRCPTSHLTFPPNSMLPLRRGVIQKVSARWTQPLTVTPTQRSQRRERKPLAEIKVSYQTRNREILNRHTLLYTILITLT